MKQPQSGYSTAQRRRAVQRLRAGDSVVEISAATGVSRSTLYRWRREILPAVRDAAPIPAAAAVPIPAAAAEGKLADLTGPGITDHWGVTATDLGATVRAPDGKLVAVFGDTFSGNKVGVGDWRSPVVLIGTGDATTPITWERAGGADSDYTEQLWYYIH